MEIEIRAFIDNFETIKSRLKELNIPKIETTKILDIWYAPKSAKTFNDVQMNKVGSQGIRIRQENNKPPEFNVKTIVKENDHNVFDELETNFNNLETMKKILDLLGYKPFCTIDKTRETYSFENMKINLENIKNFDPCIEIEIISNSNFDENLNKIHNLMDTLNVKKENKIEKSITYLYMQKFSKF